MNAVLLPAYLAAAGLLVASAVAKLRRSEPAARALAELRLPAARLLVIAGSLIEVAVAALMVARPALGAPAAAALYLCFAVLVLVQLRRGSSFSCGCLGSVELPPTRLHAGVNLTLAAVCAAARPEPLGVFRHPVAGGVVWVAAATTAWAVAAGLELLPAALDAYRRPVA